MYCSMVLVFAGTMLNATAQHLGSIREDFSSDSLTHFYYGSTGNRSIFKCKSGVKCASEKRTKILALRIDPNDSAGAGRGPEIISRDFTQFGTYSSRLKVPDVRSEQPNTGAVVGFFTYHMDSVAGLSEIDFEWLVADPTIIYVGTWTGRQGKLTRIGRTVNLAKGIIYNTVTREGHAGTNKPLTGGQNKPDTIAALAGYDASASFYTYGFDWSVDRITWWIINPANKQKIILWDYKGSTLGIPQHASKYRINFWHTNDWPVETNPMSLEKPKQPYELEVDWMSYEAQR